MMRLLNRYYTRFVLNLIVDKTITSVDIADNTISRNQIATSTITSSEIQTGTFTENQCFQNFALEPTA